jgi:hypothetical protein
MSSGAKAALSFGITVAVLVSGAVWIMTAQNQWAQQIKDWAFRALGIS